MNTRNANTESMHLVFGHLLTTERDNCIETTVGSCIIARHHGGKNSHRRRVISEVARSHVRYITSTSISSLLTSRNNCKTRRITLENHEFQQRKHTQILFPHEKKCRKLRTEKLGWV